MPPSPNQHLLNTSWTLHRLSPLHHGKENQSLLDNPAALNTYATRLRDQLTGNAVSGISASAADDESLSRTGALKTCVWEILPSLSLLDNSAAAFTATDHSTGVGISVTLEYENITYKAALLAPLPGDDASSSDRRKGKGRQREPSISTSTHLPLLMTRFPNPLRQTFLSFLSANFDTYVSNLRLSSNFMCSALETYLYVLNPGLDDSDSETEPVPDRLAQKQILEDLVKELQLTVAFSPAVAPALRSLNVNVPRASLGKILLPADPGSESSSVLKGLSNYIRAQLALDLDLAGDSEDSAIVKQHVRVSKIACAGFNIAGEGRLKLVGQALGSGGGEEGGGEDEGGSGGLSEKSRLGLRANEALLRAVIRRAVATGENQAS
ncbi:uncharacterized protein KD926_000820 [Aspergillus affinis]|uniref:uncharacterized protein n=1 Tax=Aspergillus affinis TaxID=1070780 RepID=UPI0022FE123B|nr:uncharacterized protein KD926_000820 [Aspergillus affinis]KAI9037103.1 hypothetical protein KD926_000820 [Aspergillus affinis]